MPKAAVTLEQLEHMMQDAKARLPQLSWDTLDAHTYQALLPGMQKPLRVAVSGDVFDDHSDSHTLLSYGGAFFNRMLADSLGNTDPQPGPGVCWLDSRQSCPAIVINTLDGLKRPETLSDLRACLHRVAEPADAPEPTLIRIA